MVKCPFCPSYGLPEHELQEEVKDGHKLYTCTVLHKRLCEHMLTETNPEKFACIDCDDNVEKCNCNDCMGGVFCQVCQIVNTECADVWRVIRKNQEKMRG